MNWRGETRRQILSNDAEVSDDGADQGYEEEAESGGRG